MTPEQIVDQAIAYCVGHSTAGGNTDSVFAGVDPDDACLCRACAIALATRLTEQQAIGRRNDEIKDIVLGLHID